MTKTQQNIIKLVAGGVIIYGIWYTWNKVLVTINPKPVSAPASLDLLTSRNPSSKTPQGKKKTYTVSKYRIPLLAQNIYKALDAIFGGWNEILAIFLEIKTQGDASALALSFYSQYQIDLWTYLQKGQNILPTDGLSTDHLNYLKDYVTKLPA